MWRSKKTTDSPRDAALRLLSRREHSARELRQKLAARGIESAEADQALETLQAHDLQSDARYAEQLIRTRIGAGYGPRRIRAELEQAGLNRDEARLALDAAGCDWAALARATLQRRFRAAAQGPMGRRKQQQFLYARGFESRDIEVALGGEQHTDGM